MFDNFAWEKILKIIYVYIFTFFWQIVELMARISTGIPLLSIKHGWSVFCFIFLINGQFKRNAQSVISNILNVQFKLCVNFSLTQNICLTNSFVRFDDLQTLLMTTWWCMLIEKKCAWNKKDLKKDEIKNT